MVLEVKYLRTKLIEELYIGMLYLGIILSFIITKNNSAELLDVRIFFVVFTIYLSAYSINFIRNVYFIENTQSISPNFIFFFIDGIFLTVFLYLTEEFLNISGSLFIVYIVFQSIRFYDKQTWIFNCYTTTCYILLSIVTDSKNFIYMDAFLTILFFFVASHVLSTVLLETSKLESYAKHMYIKLKDNNRLLENMVSKDYLTDMYNHRSFYSFLKDVVVLSKQKQIPFCLSILDLDNFKRVNDTYGHLAGDYILKEISAIIHNNLRENDIAARYGGEEFAIIFPKTTLSTSKVICEQIRSEIEDSTFIHDNNDIKITISGGLGEAIISGEDLEQYNFVNFVDELLYDAKANGKNQIKLAETSVVIN